MRNCELRPVLLQETMRERALCFPAARICDHGMAGRRIGGVDFLVFQERKDLAIVAGTRTIEPMTETEFDQAVWNSVDSARRLVVSEVLIWPWLWFHRTNCAAAPA